MDDLLKRNIRESLVYAQQVPDRLKKRLVISEFFHSLNRKGVLLNHEVEDVINDAYQLIDVLADEQEANDRFVEIVGGIKRADRLQQIWNMSYLGYKKTREENFRERAKAEGYTDEQIDAFLSLP